MGMSQAFAIAHPEAEAYLIAAEAGLTPSLQRMILGGRPDVLQLEGERVHNGQLWQLCRVDFDRVVAMRVRPDYVTESLQWNMREDRPDYA